MNSSQISQLELDKHWMSIALAQARLAEAQGEVPVGAVLVNSQGEVALGHNLRETHTDPTAHAELLAVQKASAVLKRWRLSDCTLYVTLEPCFMCAGAIVLARIPRVVFATFDPKTGASGSLANILQDSRLNHRCEVSAGVLAEESSLLLKSFFRKKRSAAKKIDL